MKTKIFATIITIVVISGVCFSQPRNGGMKPPSIEERLKMIDEKICQPLKLDKPQKEAVASAFNEFFTEMDKLMEANSKPSMPDKSKIEPLEKARDEKVKIVIPDTLFSKYRELEKTSRPKAHNEGRERSK